MQKALDFISSIRTHVHIRTQRGGKGRGGGGGQPLLINPVFDSAEKILTAYYSEITHTRKINKNAEDLGSPKVYA